MSSRIATWAFFVASLLLCLCPPGEAHAQKTNPITGINWPQSTGMGMPTIACNATYTGTLYSDVSVTPNVQYICKVDNTVSPATYAWAVNGGCTGLTGTYNFTNQVATLSKGCITAVGNPFTGTIVSCSPCSGPLEVGNSTTNPATFTFSYANGTPASGTIQDDIGHSSTLTPPYTSGSISQSYCTAAQGATTIIFGLSATSTTGQTTGAGASVQCEYRVWTGIGTTGATGVTVSGTGATLEGATGTLTSPGLGNGAGTYNFTPAGAYPYVITPGVCNRSYTVGGFAVPMLTTAITIVNTYGASSGYCLAQTSSNQNNPVTMVVQ